MLDVAAIRLMAVGEEIKKIEKRSGGEAGNCTANNCRYKRVAKIFRTLSPMFFLKKVFILSLLAITSCYSGVVA